MKLMVYYWLLHAAKASGQSTDHDGLNDTFRAKKCVRLVANEPAFRLAFARFDSDDAVNILTADKLRRMGQVAQIVDSYQDRTMTLLFLDGTTADFPWESAASGVSCHGLNHQKGSAGHGDMPSC